MEPVTPAKSGEKHNTGKNKNGAEIIGLLGGSFNPAHDGHLAISKTALQTIPLDRVWWLVSPGNPLKDLTAYAPYDARCAHAKSLIDDPRISVSEFEKIYNTQYTIDTIKALIRHYPDKQFVWLMGADSLVSFHLWKDWRTIADLVSIAIFNRPGSETAAETAVAAKELSRFKVEFADAPAILMRRPPTWVFVPVTNNPLSSTVIRSAAEESS